MPRRNRYVPRHPLPAPADAPPRERRELDAVRDVVHAMASGELAEESLQFALDRIAPHLGASLGSVYVLDGASELMRLVAAHQWPAQYRPWLGEMRVRVGFGPSGEAASERRVIDVPNVFADPDLEDWHDVARELGFAAITALPLIAAGRVLGVATFYFKESIGAEGGTRTLLRLVADLLALAADHAARRDELRRLNASLQDATADVERQYAAAARLREIVDVVRDVGGDGTVGADAAIDEFDPRVPMREVARDLAASSTDVRVSAVEPVLALPSMRGGRQRIVRLLAILTDQVRERTITDSVELTVDTAGHRVRFRVQETGRTRMVFDEPARADSAARGLPPGSALDFVRGVARLMGGDVVAEVLPEGRAALTLDLPLDGPPGAAAHG